jgi:hypothetical protein
MIRKAARRPDGVDQAVLAGTALVAVGTANGGVGEWNPFDMVSGVILLIILAAFHQPAAQSTRRAAVLREIAAAGITALCCCVMTAWPIQHLLDHHPLSLLHMRCSLAPLAARTRQSYPAQYDPTQSYPASTTDCASRETSSYLLPALWFVLTTALFCLHLPALKRSGQQDAVAGAAQPAGSARGPEASAVTPALPNVPAPRRRRQRSKP